MYPSGCFKDFELSVFTSGYYGAVEDSEALLSLYLRFKNDGYYGNTMNCCRLHRPTSSYADNISIAVMGNGKD